MESNLSQKTIVVLGPVKGTLQNLVMALAQEGADVGMVASNGDQLQRFCQNINDQREIKDKYGRAMAVKADLSQWVSIKDGMGKIAQSFGSIDILIDNLTSEAPTPFQISGDEAALDPIVYQNLNLSLRAAQFASGFMKGRKRGRIIFLLHDTFNRGFADDCTAAAARTGLIAFSRSLSRQMQEFHVTVNCLSLGLTEEYLLAHFPDATSVKEAQEKMKVLDPSARVSDVEKVAHSVLFLSSNAGAAVSGQNIVLS